MSQKTVVTCDAAGCCNEHEHHGGDYLPIDITIQGWFCDYENESDYCPEHAAAVKAEINGL